MIVPRYVPGDWVAVVSDGTVAMVPAHVDGATVDRLWESLRAGEGLGTHLEVLVERGLASVPPFALVSLADGAAHVIVRGELRVMVDAEDGEHELDGAAVTTWHEATVRRARSVHVRARGARVGDADGGLPVLSAVVRAAAVDVELVREPARGRRAVAGRSAAGTTARRATPAPAVREPAPAEERATASAAVSVVPEPTPAAPEPVPLATEPYSVPVEPRPEPEQLAEPEPRPEPEQPAEPADDNATDGNASEKSATDDSATEKNATQEDPAASTTKEDEPADASAAQDLPPSPGPEVPAAPTSPADAAGPDHDGLTVQSSDVATLRRQLPEWAGDAVPGPFTVPAPQAPPPAKIHLSSGLVISLNRPVLLGRAPQVSRVQNSQIPRLVTVASPNQDISRTHAEVRQEGDHVLVTDLRSTNGVLLQREGAGPQRLHPGDPTIVETGVVVDLGEGVTFVVDHGA